MAASVRRVVAAAASMATAASPGAGTINCKLLVCGGGAGGCSIAAKYADAMGPGGCVVVEPADTHYYQPMWTLVGGGMKTLDQSARSMASVLPKKAKWIQDSVAAFEPQENRIVTANGTEIKYEFMVVALGLDLHYEAIPGLEEALAMEGSGVCSNYSHKYVNRTYKCIQDFQKGNALFTFPNTPIKCAGAPQKAAYVTDALLRKLGKRERASVKYRTSLPAIFSAKKYADKLWEVCRNRDINVALRRELVEIKPSAREAVFKNLEKPFDLMTEDFEMLHVVPPMGPPAVLKNCPELTDQAGYLSVNRETLQHTKYQNIFGIGDCTNLPTSKTAAAVAAQNGVLSKNLSAVIRNQPPTAKYDGYTSCPLVTSLNTCILAEFDYNLEPLETFPFDQSKERYTSFFLKKEIMPLLYWHGLLNGLWNGPAFFRHLFHLGLK